MKQKYCFGDHNIFECYETLSFIDYFKELYQSENLENLHLKSQDYKDNIDKLDEGVLTDCETDIHKKFYNDIKSNNNFKKIYCNFIKYIHNYFFDKDEYLIYQSFPSIRMQFPKSKAIPPHKDSDSLSNHPVEERNFLVPVTNMENTNTIFIESEPDKEDFKSIRLEVGDLFYFNGALCTHYNKKNEEGKLRISLDFRVITSNDYLKYINKWNPFNLLKNDRDTLKMRDPTKMIIGGYYQITHKNESLEDMMNWYKIDNFIMQHRPTFEKEEAEEVYKYMLEDNFITEHKKTFELEKIICNHLGVKNCIMTTSGTSAIILSLMALDLKPDDEVIVPNFTMIATINSVKMLGLKPVIIDVDAETCTLNLEKIKEHVTDKTKCIIHVSLNNRYKNLDKIVNYCNENNIYLIEDAAQSLGCKVNGKSLGTFGIIGNFSLSTPKIISTGQGGFCVTDNDEIAKKINMIKNFGRKESGKDDFVTFGVNLKYTDIQAVIGIEQMKKLDWRVKRLREIYNLYFENLKDVVEMKEPLSEEWLPWFVDIYIENREDLMLFLKKHKIGTRPVYGEIDKTNIYYKKEKLPNSNEICRTGLFLPSYITLKNEDIIHICKLIKYFYKFE